MIQPEANTADALLDRPLTIHLPAPWLFRLLGVKVIPFSYKRPVYAQLLRMSREYVKMGIDLEELSDGNVDTLFSLLAKKGVKASRIIALGMIRGSITSFLFCRPLAWYLRRHMDARRLAELTKLILYLSGAEDFASIIRSIAYMKVTAPVLSQQKTES